jgi:hypothetical protein
MNTGLFSTIRYWKDDNDFYGLERSDWMQHPDHPLAVAVPDVAHDANTLPEVDNLWIPTLITMPGPDLGDGSAFADFYNLDLTGTRILITEEEYLAHQELHPLIQGQ